MRCSARAAPGRTCRLASRASRSASAEENWLPLRFEFRQLIISRIVHLRAPSGVDDNGREGLFDNGRRDDLMSGPEVRAAIHVRLLVALAQVGAARLGHRS